MSTIVSVINFTGAVVYNIDFILLTTPPMKCDESSCGISFGSPLLIISYLFSVLKPKLTFKFEYFISESRRLLEQNNLLIKVFVYNPFEIVFRQSIAINTEKGTTQHDTHFDVVCKLHEI